MSSASQDRPPSSERTPLLRDGDFVSQSTEHGGRRSIWSYCELPKFETKSREFRFVPLLGCIIILLNEVEYFFKQVPVMRALEALFCIEYYQVHDPDLAKLGRHIPEKLCKADVIEKEVAKSAGFIMFFRMLCCIIGAIPLGYLADKKGRRFVLIMHKVGAISFIAFQLTVYLSYPILPIWAIYFAGVGGLIGGNFDLNLAMLFASYADVMPVAAQRTTLFFLTTAMQYVGQAIFPSIAGVVMNLDGQGTTPEASLFVSLGISIVAILIPIFIFPETLEKRTNPQSAEDDNIKATDGADEVIQKSTLSLWGSVKQNVKQKLGNITSSVEGIGVTGITLLSIAMFCTAIGIKSTDWWGLVQYPVIKLDWTFPQASSVVSMQAVVYLVNFAILLPLYTRLGAQYELSPSASSLLVMLFSCIILVVGSVFLGFSATSATFLISMVIYTLGTGLPVTIQAYIANLIDAKQLARVMAALSIATTAGKMAASALAPIVLGAGLDSGVEVLKGVQFFWAASLFVVAGVAVALVRCIEMGRRRRAGRDTSSEEF